MKTLPENSLVVLMGGKVKYMSNRTSPSCCRTPSRPHRLEARDIVRRAVYLTSNWPLTPSSYKFRQASDFWYLTGFDEPDAAVILGSSLHPLLSSRSLNPGPIRKEHLPKRVQDVSLLVRLESREGKVGRCKVGTLSSYSLPPSIIRTQDDFCGCQGPLCFR